METFIDPGLTALWPRSQLSSDAVWTWGEHKGKPIADTPSMY